MKEIKELNSQLNKDRKSATITIGIILTCGFLASIPLFNDSVKYSETLYCTHSNCTKLNIKRGVSYLVWRERRNQLFDRNIKILKILPPEDSTAIYLAVAGSLFFFTAYGISKNLTNKQEKSIHTQFKYLKIQALENDLIESTHLDLFGFSKQNQSEITKQAIARQTSETIEAMKSPGEIQLDHINGQLQGELAVKTHELNISELDKNIAENKLSTAEINRKLDKLSKPVSDSKQPSADEQLKTALIDALKAHEDGFLWTIISSLKPLWLCGNQGSGKTYTASAVGLIRKYCLDAPIRYLIDRHATGDNAEVWKYLQPSIKAETEGDIATAFNDCCDRWLLRIKEKASQREQVIVDEFTNLKSLIGDTAVNFFKMSLTDTRKAKTFLLGITHNTTNESFPDGTAAARKAGSILIERFSANGETPLPRIVVRYGLVDSQGNTLEDVEKTIPSWFHPERIYQHFNGKPIVFE